MKEKYDILSNNKFKYGNLKLKSLIIDMDKNDENNLGKNKDESEDTIFDLIIKIMILLYGFNKEIKEKMKGKIKKSEKYFLINSEWIKQFKNNYNYPSIYNYLLQNYNYSTYSQYESNINLILENIKNSNIIKDKEKEFIIKDMKDISFIPFQEKLKNNFMKHYIKFNIINSKINEMIKKLMLLQKINYYNNHAYYFYIGPKTILKGHNFFEIGYFGFQDEFISKYYFLFDKTEYINKEIKILAKMKDINKYFTLRNIEKQTKEIQDLNISNEKVGTIFNLKINNIIGKKSSDKKDIKKNKNNKKYISKKDVRIKNESNINKQKNIELMKYVMKLK